MAIDTEIFVMLADAQDYERTHFDGCEIYHLPCAVKYLAGALDAAQKRLDEYAAEIERLRGIIRGTEWVLSADEYDPSKETIVVQYECAICHFVYLDSPGEHAEHCPFYQWEGGAQ